MSKNVERTAEIRLRGFAETNGVAYEAGLFYGLAGVNRIGKLVTAKEDGTLSCEDYDFDTNIPEISRKIRKRGKIIKIISLILALVCIIGYIATAFASPTENYLGFGMAYIFLGISFMNNATAIGLGKFVGDQDMENYSQYAGAKNSVLNSYYLYGKVPTMEEAKQVARTIERAEYVENANFASFLILLGICRFLPTFWFLVASIALIFISIKADSKFFKWGWQMIATTSKPEEIHYQAAIKALEEALEWTKNIKVKVSRKEIPLEELKQVSEHVFEEEKCKECPSYEDCKKMWSMVENGSQKIYQDVVEIVEEPDDEQ